MYIEIKSSFIGTYLEVLSSIRIFGGFNHKWYVGLTSDSKYSFLEVHNLNLLETEWILSNNTDLPVLRFLKKIFVQMGYRNNDRLDMQRSDQLFNLNKNPFHIKIKNYGVNRWMGWNALAIKNLNHKNIYFNFWIEGH